MIKHIRPVALTFSLLYFIGRNSSTAQSVPDSSQIKNDSVRIPTPEIVPMDTITRPGHNAYGDLLNDDPAYNKRYPVWVPAVGIIGTNVVNWAIARYVYNFDWARISSETWKQNLKGPWVWDKDRFGINFIGHPHTGSTYFNTARSNGYNYYQSLPFTLAGSAIWEVFGENEPPSKNDIINTTLSGAFLGEVFYRVSSNILDDRDRGASRVFRELFAAVLNPNRAINRLWQGKMFRVTNKEVYQEEPLNITLSAGVHKQNENQKFLSGGTNAIFNLQLDYGDPFELRRRKPFDLFRLRFESRYGDEKKLIDNVTGYGLIAGKNILGGKQGVLLGVFQHFDYWNNVSFELGSLGFGPGLLSRIDLAPRTKLYSGIHFAVVPLAGNNTRFGPDSLKFRDYNFGGGMEGKIEETFHFSRWLTIGINAYYYWIYEYEGLKGKSRVGIIKPRIAFRVLPNTRIGMEQHVYWHNRFVDNQPALHQVRTEQKIFLQINLEDSKRRGKYQ
ncbi:MAG: DUF3943 domain-containing protein [Chitinophagaceae bacterium]